MTERQYKNVPGMAHFPGTGPANKECGDCYYYGDGRGHSCKMWRELMGGEAPGPEVSAFNRACKYYQPPEKIQKKIVASDGQKSESAN